VTDLKSPGFNLKTLKDSSRRVVSLPEKALVQSSYLSPGQTLPLVLQPTVDQVDLADWAAGNRDELETQLIQYGAILFRGFNIDTPSAFECFGLTLCQTLFNENGEHPRQTISGNVYTPIFYPADQKILWHNENSFNQTWPRKILFCCRQPAAQGGETPIVDSRRIYDKISSKIRDKFMQKQVMYLRNYGDGFGLDWQTVFQTTNPEEVEARCRYDSIDFEWKPGNRLRTKAVRPAVIQHPKTGEMAWFAQLTHWHPACLESGIRESLQSSFPDEALPRNCYYGDGSPIEAAVMAEICAVYQELEVSFPWQKGDVLVLDNQLTAHARNPFVGERKLFVAMGDMASFE
jgi:alpha-ketoglutarate-dependent taurine dioxygenase